MVKIHGFRWRFSHLTNRCEPGNMVFPELLQLKETDGDKLKEKLVEIIIQAFCFTMDGCWLLDIMQTRGSWKIDSTANMKILLNQSRGLISLNHQPSGLTMNGVCLDVWHYAELRVQCDFSFTWRWHGLDTRMLLTHQVVGQTTASSLVNSMPSFEVSIPPISVWWGWFLWRWIQTIFEFFMYRSVPWISKEWVSNLAQRLGRLSQSCFRCRFSPGLCGVGSGSTGWQS